MGQINSPCYIHNHLFSIHRDKYANFYFTPSGFFFALTLFLGLTPLPMCIPSLRDYHKKTFYTAYSRKILRFYKTLENRRDGARTASTTRQKDKKRIRFGTSTPLCDRTLTSQRSATEGNTKRFLFQKKKNRLLSFAYVCFHYICTLNRQTNLNNTQK